MRVLTIFLLFLSICLGQNDVGSLQTGQTVSYTDKDDGYYKKSIARGFDRAQQQMGYMVYDESSDIIWSDDDNISGDASYASAVCSDFDSLPNIQQLQSLVDNSKSNPAVFDTFQNTVSDFYWSSTDKNSSHTWVVDFRDGSVTVLEKTETAYIRCTLNQDQIEWGMY